MDYILPALLSVLLLWPLTLELSWRAIVCFSLVLSALYTCFAVLGPAGV